MSAQPAVNPHAQVNWRASTAVAVVMSLLMALGLAACTSSAKSSPRTSQPSLGYRPLPSFLPTSAAPVDQVTTASPGHPQLAVQGIAVQVDMPSGRALVTVTGPHVPPFVAPPPEQVTAVFDVSLTHVSGTIPVRLDDITITDQLGRSFHPTLVLHATPPPSTVTAGQTLDFQVTAVMPTGEGRLYWAPTQSTPFVGWDFIVEND